MGWTLTLLFFFCCVSSIRMVVRKKEKVVWRNYLKEKKNSVDTFCFSQYCYFCFFLLVILFQTTKVLDFTVKKKSSNDSFWRFLAEEIVCPSFEGSFFFAWQKDCLNFRCTFQKNSFKREGGSSFFFESEPKQVFWCMSEKNLQNFFCFFSWPVALLRKFQFCLFCKDVINFK